MAIFSPASFMRRRSRMERCFRVGVCVDMLGTSGVGPAGGVLPIGESGTTLIRTRAERHVMLPALSVLPDHGEERLDVLRAPLEIEVARVDDEERGVVVVEEELI